MKKVKGLKISKHEKSKRIYDIKIENALLTELQFLFKKFDLTTLELKPFSRFTIAKILDDLTESKLDDFMNSILRDRNSGCFIMHQKIQIKI